MGREHYDLAAANDAVPGDSRRLHGQVQVDLRTIVGLFREICYRGYHPLELPVMTTAGEADQRLAERLEFFAGFEFGTGGARRPSSESGPSG